MEIDYAFHTKATVRLRYPQSVVEADGLMFVVREHVGGRALGPKKTTPDRAWVAASDLIKANA